MNRTIYVVFIDFEEALDRVPRNKIKNRNVNNKLRQTILGLYRTTRNYVATDNMELGEFVVEEGLRQGYST